MIYDKEMALFPVTVHMLVQNEDQFIWYALMSVIDQVEQIFITDNGSTDHTLELIQSIASPKIILEKLSATDRAGLVARRQAQLEKTKTTWFMILDGDEIWPKIHLEKYLQSGIDSEGNTIGVICRTRNCVGDIFHFQPDDAGKYSLKGVTGHLTVRLMRNKVSLTGEYPNEAFTYLGQPIQELPDLLLWCETWYLHTTHLHRSSQREQESRVIDRMGKYKHELGITLSKQDIPEVFFDRMRPHAISDPTTTKMSWSDWGKSAVVTPLKQIRRNLM